MKVVYGIEVKPLLFSIPEFKQYFEAEFEILAVYGQIYLLPDKEKAFEAVKLLEEAELFEEMHVILQVNHGHKGDNFMDFGFKGVDHTFLFRDSVCAFLLSAHDKKLLEMAEYQIDEHLLFSTVIDCTKIYFVEKHLKELILGIGHAYGTQVNFLDLDKL